MYKATRSLIKLRQPHSNALVEKVFVRRIEGGVKRQCYENACLLFEKNKNYKIVSGWFVTEWDKFASSCLALSHYWNIDETGNFVDCSPMENLSAEYVIDSEIGIFSSQNFDKLKSNVCSSIIFKTDSISGVDFRESGKVYRLFKDFSVDSLFSELNVD